MIHPTLMLSSETAFPLAAFPGQHDLKKGLFILAVDPSLRSVLLCSRYDVGGALLAGSFQQFLKGLYVQSGVGGTAERGTPPTVILVPHVFKMPPPLPVKSDLLSDQDDKGPDLFIGQGILPTDTENLRDASAFTLLVHATAEMSVDERVLWAQRQLMYEQNPKHFIHIWHKAQQALLTQIHQARQVLPHIPLQDSVLRLASQACDLLGITDLPVVLMLYKAARAHAALHGRAQLTLADVHAAAQMTLAHQQLVPKIDLTLSATELRTLLPLGSLVEASEVLAPRPPDEAQPSYTPEVGTAEPEPAPSDGAAALTPDEVKTYKNINKLPDESVPSVASAKKPPRAPVSVKPLVTEEADDLFQDFAAAEDFVSGFLSDFDTEGFEFGAFDHTGAYQRSHDPYDPEVRDTVVDERPLAPERSAQTTPQPQDTPPASTPDKTLELEKDFSTPLPTVNLTTDLPSQASLLGSASEDSNPFEQQEKLTPSPSSSDPPKLLFMVDASGSMAARRRLEMMRETILALLQQTSYAITFKVFRSMGVQTVLQGVRQLEQAQAALSEIPSGGDTPLAHALADMAKLLLAERYTLGVLLTDGRATVALGEVGSPWKDALHMAQQLKGQPVLVCDTETGFIKQGRAFDIAQQIASRYEPLDEMTSDALAQLIQREVDEQSASS